MTKSMEKSGPFAVVRDAEGRIVHRHLDRGGPRKNWKHYARLRSNDGADMLDIIERIARGEAMQTEVTLPTGEKVLSEPQVPNVSTMLEAAKSYFEFVHGKAVAATEVVKAEEEAEAMARLKSMSDEELERLVRVEEEAQLVDGEPEPALQDFAPYDMEEE